MACFYVDRLGLLMGDTQEPEVLSQLYLIKKELNHGSQNPENSDSANAILFDAFCFLFTGVAAGFSKG
jgi:hypothetical protein